MDLNATLAMTPQLHLPIGTRVGSYRIVGRIGEGGMGVVYAAEHVELGKRVAIKTLRADLAADESLRARFLREGRAAAAVRHPHVVDVHDVGVHESTPYLVMELLDGQDLAAHVARTGLLRADEAADLMLPVLTAMAAAHHAGVVHRDLKPENVFLARGPGGTSMPKVLDFGISKVRELKSMSLTGGGTLLGTPFYMSPEQASSAKDVDARADLYSLGVVLYHCVSGRVPFQGDSLAQLIGRILHAEPPPLAETNAKLPPGFEEIVRRAMAKDPAQRFQTAIEFGRALLPFASPRTRLLFEHEFATAVGASNAALAETAPSGAGIDPVSAFDPTVHSHGESAKAPRAKHALWIALAAVVVCVGLWLALRQEPTEQSAPDTSASTPTLPTPPPPAPPPPAVAAPVAPAEPSVAPGADQAVAPSPSPAAAPEVATPSVAPAPAAPAAPTRARAPRRRPTEGERPIAPVASPASDPFGDRK